MRPSHAPQRTPWFELALLMLGSRALIALVAILGALIIEPGKFGRGAGALGQLFFHWDSTWFVSVAQAGYQYQPGAFSSVAFFPFYPLLIRLFAPLAGGPVAAGYLVSNVAFAGSILLLWKLIERDAGEPDSGVRPGDGSRAVRLLVFGPVSFFLSIIYSEAAFLFLIIACVYASRSRRWWLAGLCGFGAALTRNAGILLCLPLLFEFFQVSWKRPRIRLPERWPAVAACFLPCLGFIAWSGYLWRKFADPLLFLKVQASWGRRLDWPWVSFRREQLWNFPIFHQWWFVGHAAVGIVLLVVATVVRLRPSYVAFAAVMLLLDFSATHLESIPRLLCVIFPLYIAGAVMMRRAPAAEALVIAASAGFLALSVLLFVNGYWFT